MEKLSRINAFRDRKTRVSSTFLIKLKFWGYRCKSGNAIFAWRVTWNYAYSPFNTFVFGSSFWFTFRKYFLPGFKRKCLEFKNIWFSNFDQTLTFPGVARKLTQKTVGPIGSFVWSIVNLYHLISLSNVGTLILRINQNYPGRTWPHGISNRN